MEFKEKVKSVKSWSRLQRVGNWNVKRRKLECQEEVKGMLGEGKKNGIINRSMVYDKFQKTNLGGFNWTIFRSFLAHIIFTVHFPFKGKLKGR